MEERRASARVVEGAKAGYIRVQFNTADQQTWTVDLTTDQVPAATRTPGSVFVAVTRGQLFCRVDADASEWLQIESKIRDVLNECWDPIGTAVAVDHEYDGYIRDLHSMIIQGASEQDVVAYLFRVETEAMCLAPSPSEKRERTARRLFALNLPSLPEGWSAA